MELCQCFPLLKAYLNEEVHNLPVKAHGLSEYFVVVLYLDGVAGDNFHTEHPLSP